MNTLVDDERKECLICRLGIPSVHHQQVCSPTGAATGRGFRLHAEISEFFFGLRRIDTSCAFMNRTMISRVKKTIDAMIATGDIDALLDSPYPYFSSYLIDAAERIRGVPPIIILTLRDPLDWAKKRASNHPFESFCRQSLNTTHTTLEMDFFKCFDQKTKNKQPDNILYSELFVEVGKIIEEDPKYGVMRIARSFDQHQSFFLPIASYATNLFKRSPALSAEELSDEISNLVPHINQYWSPSTKLIKQTFPLHPVLDFKCSDPLEGRKKCFNQ